MTIEQQTINVAILGFGLSGSTFHAPIISTTPGLQITHILSKQKDKIQSIYPDVEVLNDVEEILANPNIHLVINTLPNEEHYSYTKKILLANKHAIVEKPFVIDSSQGEELIELAKSKNLVLSVYHNRRWDNGFLTLQKYKQQLGKVYLYEAYFDRFRPEVNSQKWREQNKAGSGILYDLGSHLIDQALFLFGKPSSIYADLLNQRENSSTIDYFHITLFYDNFRVILGSSSIILDPRPTLAIYGNLGSYVKYGLDPQENALKAGVTPDTLDFGVETPENSGKLFLQKNDSTTTLELISEAGSYSTYYKGIYNSIIYDQAAPVSAISALEVIRVIEKCLQSNKEKSRVNY